MRNRGYKYIIKCSDEGYWLLCINATWINQMLRDRGIKPKEFRSLTYKDLAAVMMNGSKRELFLSLQPQNFWQMCDALALSTAQYDGAEAYKQEWFWKTPIFTLEDVYEHLMEEDFQQEDAIRVMEFAHRGRCHTLSLNREEFLQLYDVPQHVQEALAFCKHLPRRELVVLELLDIIECALLHRRALDGARSDAKKK